MTSTSLSPVAAKPPPDPWVSLRELLGLLFGSLPGIRVAPLLADTAPDPGLFGPGSATWLVAREPLLLLGGARALLMQVAHPLVAQGVIDHSDHATDPFGRLVRTVRWLISVTFGTRAEAMSAIREVNRMHARVRGALAEENAGDTLAAGTPYTAADPELARWVHATIVHSMLVSYDTFVGPFDGADRSAMVREWNRVAALMRVPPEGLWRDAADLDEYVSSQTRTLDAAPPASRAAAAVVLHPPLPTPLLRPVFASVGFLSVGMLPVAMRRGFGLRWNPARARSFGAVTRSIRVTQHVLPSRLRITPLYHMAMNRTLGRGLLATPS